jgi:hypothetical protein
MSVFQSTNIGKVNQPHVVGLRTFVVNQVFEGQFYRRFCKISEVKLTYQNETLI